MSAPVDITRLPYEPLGDHLRGIERVQRLSMTRAARSCDVSRETLLRWRRTGQVPVFAADRVAVRLGVHPAAIWGSHWWAAVEPDEQKSQRDRMMAKLERSGRSIDLSLRAIDARRDGAPWPALRLVDAQHRDAAARRADRIDGALGSPA